MSRPAAVILGLADTGYGVVRSLAGHGIPIIAYESKQERPEARTRLAEVRSFADEDELLASLVELGANSAAVPVLYPTSDAMVSFFSRNRDALTPHFRIDYPSTETVDLLLEKGRFPAFADEHGFSIPATFSIQSMQDLAAVRDGAPFPAILKPFYRKKNWHAARYPKVFRFETLEALEARIEEILAVESELVLQEWIPGGDSAVHFCLTYFDSESQSLAQFTGHKLRQWPVGTGSTSCAEPIDAAYVTDETLRLFRTVGYRGFGSVEFKRHSENGRYYITEPTVGRSNHQSFVATINGVNLQLTAYASLTGERFEMPQRKQHPVAWIDDQFDPLSVLVSLVRGKLEWSALFRSYLGRRKFRFFNFDDMRPFIHAIFLRGPRVLLRQIWRRLVG